MRSFLRHHQLQAEGKLGVEELRHVGGELKEGPRGPESAAKQRRSLFCHFSRANSAPYV